MGLFDSPEQKWIKRNDSAVWNRAFTNFTAADVMITKLMVWESVNFSDRLLTASFRTENQALRFDTILLAKMQFYHLVTQSATVHNLFYGYLHELYVNILKEDPESVQNALSRMHTQEKWYLTWYYDYYERENGEFKDVLRQYCTAAASNKTTEGIPVLAVSKEELHRQAALELMTMHNSFLSEIAHMK